MATGLEQIDISVPLLCRAGAQSFSVSQKYNWESSRELFVEVSFELYIVAQVVDY